MSAMKLAIDLDGTAWKYPDLLREIAWGLKGRGWQVGILTAHNERHDHADDIAKWIARGFPPPDFYHGQSEAENRIPHRVWKEAMVRRYQIDYLFDDFASNCYFQMFDLNDPGEGVFSVFPGDVEGGGTRLGRIS